MGVADYEASAEGNLVVEDTDGEVTHLAEIYVYGFDGLDYYRCRKRVDKPPCGVSRICSRGHQEMR